MQTKHCTVAAALAFAFACGGTPSTNALSSTQANAASTSSQGQGYAIGNNTPGALKNAVDNGPVDPATVINATAWLKLHNENQLDQLVAQQTTKGNGNYQKWLTQAQFDAQFSPTAQEVKSVQNFLKAHGLATVEVAPNNWYVKVQGAVADVEKAFHVQIDSFTADGVTFRSNTGNPSINDPSGGNIAAITGLDDIGFQPRNLRPLEPDGTVALGVPLATANGVFFEGQCFRAPETHTFSVTGTTGTYSGNRYGADITSNTLGHLPPCGYSPGEMQKAYGLDAAYAAGYDGKGETIVITDAYGSEFIQQDAATFSAVYGLPPVDLTIVKAQGMAQSPRNGWRDEVTLDVEWAHAMAPGAKIVLVVATAQASLDEAINLAVVQHYGNTISNSWSSYEGFGNPAQFLRVEKILEQAAAQGIDVNFSSGDNGDELANVGKITVDYPASSPHATGIGGTSVALNSDGSKKFESGWGTNLTWIGGRAIGSIQPPYREGFLFGAGGGSSLTFAKPAFQSGLAGTMRQVPDVSMLADPYTGAEIIYTDPASGNQYVGAIGGTSLASPMFSGVMAVAAQKAGHGLGQAAALVYGLPAGALNDIVGTGSATNVTGTVNGTFWSADQLAAPVSSNPFYSAFYNSPYSKRWFVISFGTDSSLSTGAGWDNVTGVGSPNGLDFVNAIGQ